MPCCALLLTSWYFRIHDLCVSGFSTRKMPTKVRTTQTGLHGDGLRLYIMPKLRFWICGTCIRPRTLKFASGAQILDCLQIEYHRHRSSGQSDKSDGTEPCKKVNKTKRKEHNLVCSCFSNLTVTLTGVTRRSAA